MRVVGGSTLRSRRRYVERERIVGRFATELEAAREIAREAGHILLKYYDADDDDVRSKAGGSPQSAADRASNRFIVQALRERFPNDGLLAEESPDDMRRPGETRVWIVDPLDGTREFLDRIGQFVVQIAFSYEGRPVVGVVYQPTTDKSFSGIIGEGAWCEQHGETRTLTVSGRDRLSTYRCVLSRSHYSDVADDMLNAIGIDSVERIGSVGMKVAALLEQRADVYIHPSSYTKLWDTAAPEAVLHAAGGTMTDCHGRPLDYSGKDIKNRNGILASNSVAHKQLTTIISPIFQQAKERGET